MGSDMTGTDPVETIEIASEDAGQRLDRWFRQHFTEVGHGHLQKLLLTGQVRVNSSRVDAGLRLQAGQQVRVPKAIRNEPAKAGGPVAASKSDRDLIESLILYEDDDVFVLDKPFGLAVQ